MTITIKETSEQLELHLTGRLDTSSAPELETALEPFWNQALDFIFDFQDLEFITSSGLRVLLRARKTRGTLGKRVAIRNVNAAISEVFELTGFTDLFDVTYRNT